MGDEYVSCPLKERVHLIFFGAGAGGGGGSSADVSLFKGQVYSTGFAVRGA